MRSKPIFSVFLITIIALLFSTYYVLAIDANYSNFSPARNARIVNSSPVISTYVKSSSELDDQSLVMKLNGSQVDAEFMYKGKWVDDWEEGRIWSVTDQREGTISFEASKLQDGINSVEVSIKDKAGNPLNDSWSFTVAEKPTFSDLTPADKSEQASLSQLSASVSDNTAVDWGTVKLKLNNSYVDNTLLNINQNTGKVTYNRIFSSGSYAAVLEAKDKNGTLSTKAWSFNVDNTPPAVSYVSGIKNGVTLNDGKLDITMNLQDSIEIKQNVKLSMDDSPLSFDIRYDGKLAYITYAGVANNGTHTLSLYTEDNLGNYMTKNWNFTVSAKPVISNETPTKYGLNNLKTAISAVVKSTNSSINAETIEFKLDGKAVSFQYDQNSGLVSYTPSESLENEAYHTVYIAASDISGISISKEWKFYTNTYPDMKDSNISSCTACHESTSLTGSNGDLENVHSKKLYFNGTHSNSRCDNCHNYISVPAGCSQCHEDPDGQFAFEPHGSSPTIKYQPTNIDPKMPIRVTENREMNDCILCHQPGSQVKGYVGYQSTPTRLLNNHDIPELHKANEPDCTGCHAKSLTHEHARDDRNDANGNAITCNTCHQSDNPVVVQAIKDKNTSCTSCHSRDAVHKNQHAKCADCHSKGSYEDSKNAH